MRTISLLEALTVDRFHDSMCRNWRRNGQTKTWKRDSARFRVPVKHGLYAYDAIDQHTDAHVPNAECKQNA